MKVSGRLRCMDHVGWETLLDSRWIFLGDLKPHCLAAAAAHAAHGLYGAISPPSPGWVEHLRSSDGVGFTIDFSWKIDPEDT